MYIAIKNYYNQNYYTIEQVKVFVKAKWINIEQYKEITGKEYVEVTQ